MSKDSCVPALASLASGRPTVSLQASLGYTGGAIGPGSPFRNYSRDITATAVASFPLMTAGLTSSQIRQAAQNDTADRIGIEIARRQALLSVTQAWDQLLGARASLAANEEEVTAANIAVEGTRQEAQVGLRNTLDVLITEQELANAQQAVVAARHDEYVAAISLLAAMGDLSPGDLVPGIGLYDPKTNFDHVRRVWPFPLTPWAPVVGAIDHLGAPAIP